MARLTPTILTGSSPSTALPSLPQTPLANSPWSSSITVMIAASLAPWEAPAAYPASPHALALFHSLTSTKLLRPPPLSSIPQRRATLFSEAMLKFSRTATSNTSNPVIAPSQAETAQSSRSLRSLHHRSSGKCTLLASSLIAACAFPVSTPASNGDLGLIVASSIEVFQRGNNLGSSLESGIFKPTAA